MNVLYYMFLLAVLLFVAACATESTPSAGCPDAGAFVKQVSQTRGQIYYDATQSSYFVRVPNSFDSYDIGFTCNLPTEFHQNGLKVQFDGQYYQYAKAVSGLAGNKYYTLSLKSVSLDR